MKALVTGAAGFIGNHLVRLLVERGHEPRALVAPGESLANLADLDVEVVRADVRHHDDVERAMRGAEAVFHLASIYAVWSREPSTIEDVNVRGTENVLEVAARAGVSRVVVTTSQGVWAGLGPAVIDEETEPDPGALEALGDAYCRSKYRQHVLVKEHAARGMDVVAVAPTVPFGPGDARPTPTGQIVTSIVNLPVFTYIESPLAPIDVRDVALGHLAALERGRAGRTYLLGGPESVTMRDFVRAVSRAAGLRRLAVRVPYALALASAYVLERWSTHVSRRPPLIAPGALRVARSGFRVDCRRSLSELGLTPRPYTDSIADALAWFARGGLLKNRRALRHILDGGP